MGKVTIAATLISTVVLLVTFGKGMLVLRGGADMPLASSLVGRDARRSCSRRT